MHETTSGVFDPLQRRDKTIDFMGVSSVDIGDAVINADAVTGLPRAQEAPISRTAAEAPPRPPARRAAMRECVKGSLSQKTAMRTAKMALVSRSAAAGAIRRMAPDPEDEQVGSHGGDGDRQSERPVRRNLRPGRSGAAAAARPWPTHW